ncbi:MAG: WG repeat-containing protein [Deltaproteobacteria bacterium]|nr:WG repeat-containing protein [Deltaproteobacteria bacterium]
MPSRPTRSLPAAIQGLGAMALALALCPLLCLGPLSVPAQAYDYELVPTPPKVGGPGKPSAKGGQGLHFFLLGRLFGFVDGKGRMAIPPTFQKADNFDAFGLARVEGKDGWGLATDKGEYAVLPVLNDVMVVDLNGGPAVWGKWKEWWGRLAMDGSWAVSPRYHKVASLGEGLLAVTYKGKTAIMGADGKQLTGFYFDSVAPFTKDKQGRVIAIVTSGGKQGLVDSQGRTLMEPTFDSLKPDFDKNGRQIYQQGGQTGVLDISGKWLIEPKFRRIEWHEDEGKYWVNEGNLSDSWTYYKADGTKEGAVPKELVLKNVSKLPFGLIGCMFQGKDEKLYGFCDEKEEMKIKPEFQTVGPFSGPGLARVSKGGKFGYIDTKGNKVIDYAYDEARDFRDDGTAFVKVGSSWGMIDSKGAVLLKPSIDDLPKPLADGLWLATEGGKKGVLGPKGAWVVAPELEDIQDFRADGNAWAKKGGLWGQVDRSGAWIRQPAYQDVGLYTAGGLAPAYQDGRFAVVDDKGAVVAMATDACGEQVLLDAAGKPSFPPSAPDPGSCGGKK